jgi:flagellar assembly protein FliH
MVPPVDGGLVEKPPELVQQVEDDVAEDEEDFSDLPLPPSSEPDEDASSGRVFGGGRRSEKPEKDLPAYKETVFIGKKPPSPPPEPTEFQPHRQEGADPDMGQTRAEPAPYTPPPPAIDKEIIAQARAEAEQMIQQAQMQAQQMVQEAMAQATQAAEEARQQAGQQGYEEGLQAGLQEGRQAGQIELQQRIQALKFQFIDLMRLRRQVLVDMEPQIVRLAWEVAKRVVGDELKTNRDVIVGVVRSSLYTLQERDEILIRVNPEEYESVKAHQSEFEAMIEGLRKFVIQPDGAIEHGSCSIETNLGNVDARIDTQFEAIRLGLEEMSKIRQFEMNDQLAGMPVEVPGDPEFETRMKADQAHGGHGQDEEEEYDEDESDDEDQYEASGEIELLPELTEEQFNSLSPEDQQQYIEAYHQQQAYLEQLQAEMAAQQSES